MKRLFIIVRFIAVASLVLQFCLAAFAQQEQSTKLGGDKESSRSGLTGLERGAVEQRPQNPEERTDWETLYSEGSAVRSTGFEAAMWWISALLSHPNSIRP